MVGHVLGEQDVPLWVIFAFLILVLVSAHIKIKCLLYAGFFIEKSLGNILV